jgi:HEPN domain-containing protein
MKGKIDLTKLWIKKAENDLITAKNSLNIKPEPPLDTICFHAQQCAEKYLKAFLVYHEIEFEKNTWVIA